jgi:neutral ceramidase
MTRVLRCSAWVVLLVSVLLTAQAQADSFKVGYARRDITPTKPTPMWGYGDRHSLLSKGVMDPLYAKAVVVDTGSEKLAIVGMDLGRAPRADMMQRIRAAVKSTSGVGLLMISGSHTHHGPVIELRDKPGEGKGKFDDAVAYVAELEQKLIDVINEAAGKTRDARIGWGSAVVEMNRNRHSKIEPKPTDPELSVLRFDDAEGKPIALVVNFAAHPTMLDGADLRFSAEYPGQMMNEVERVLGTNCVFMQGAAGDLSCRTTPETRGIEAFGKALAQKVLDINRGIRTSVPEKPSLQGMDEDFTFETRVDFKNPILVQLFKVAFFSELAAAYVHNDIADNTIRPHLTTVLVNGELALVGASGEFFSDHSNRLKARSRAKKTLFFGYCNDHHMYFPTIEGAAEGGYGADPTVSWVALGAGELMMNKALINLYTMMGKYKFKVPAL